MTYELRNRIARINETAGMRAEDIDRELNSHGYECPRGTFRRVMGGRKKINNHMIDTLSVIFDVPRSRIISDPAWPDVPRCPDHDHSGMVDY